jgi:glycosyltransferase involved in cell wall biosynthesis
MERADGRGVFFWQRAPRTASPTAPRRYRVGNLVEGLCGSTAVIRTGPSPGVFRGASVVICLRPTFDRVTQSVVEACRRAGSLVVADFDDLLFDGPVSDWPDVIAGALATPEAERKLSQYRRALGLFDAFTASTSVLADALREASGGARVAVVPNGVSHLWLRQGAALETRRPAGPRVIRYLPGSRHDHDFEVAAPAIARFMTEHPDVVLEILGPSERIPSSIPEGRVRRVARVPFDHLPRWLARSWLTLAPLADTRFNRAKSAIKFLESAAFGTPCIATPIDDMQENEMGGVQLVASDAEWEAALDRLSNSNTYREVSELGARWVRERGTATRSVTALQGALREWTR